MKTCRDLAVLAALVPLAVACWIMLGPRGRAEWSQVWSTARAGL